MPARNQPVRPRQQSHERQSGDDEDEPGERLLRLVAQHAGDQVRRSAERNEHDREAGDEREAGQCHAPAHAGKLAIEAVDRAMRGEKSPSPIYEGEDSVIAWMLGGPNAVYQVPLPAPCEPCRCSPAHDKLAAHWMDDRPCQGLPKPRCCSHQAP